MCFSPQRRAIFRHRNFKRRSGNVVFCAFCLANALRATSGCHFSTLELQKLGPSGFFAFSLGQRTFKKCSDTVIFFNIFTRKCISRNSGVQFFDIGPSKSAPTPSVSQRFHLKMGFSPQRRAIFLFFSDHLTPHRRFNEPTFRTSGATNH